MKKVSYPRMLSFRATEEINDLIERLSEVLRISKSEVIRRAIIHHAQQLGLQVSTVKYTYKVEPGKGRRKVYEDVDVVIV